MQGRAGEDYSWPDGFNNREAEWCALAERAFVRGLGGGCGEPIGAYASIENNMLYLRGFYHDEAEQKTYTGTVKGSMSEPEQAGRLLAREFIRERMSGQDER